VGGGGGVWGGGGGVGGGVYSRVLKRSGEEESLMEVANCRKAQLGKGECLKVFGQTQGGDTQPGREHQLREDFKSFVGYARPWEGKKEVRW